MFLQRRMWNIPRVPAGLRSLAAQGSSVRLPGTAVPAAASRTKPGSTRGSEADRELTV